MDPEGATLRVVKRRATSGLLLPNGSSLAQPDWQCRFSGGSEVSSKF
jgi:hypothetical protein